MEEFKPAMILKNDLNDLLCILRFSDDLLDLKRT